MYHAHPVTRRRLIHHQQMPALVIFGSVVQSVRCQLIPPQRAVIEVNLAAQPLHFADEPQMADRVVFDVLEKSGYGGRRGEQNQSLIE